MPAKAKGRFIDPMLLLRTDSVTNRDILLNASLYKE
jgi:hypothetical protein